MTVNDFQQQEVLRGDTFGKLNSTQRALHIQYHLSSMHIYLHSVRIYSLTTQNTREDKTPLDPDVGSYLTRPSDIVF